MKLYLENLIPRVKNFSLSLDKQEIFIDKPWVIVDEEHNKQTYVFQRNGELIMSLNGQVTIGKWNYLIAAKSLLIDRIEDKILLNQSFVDPALMILKKDGFKEDNFILANLNLIPDLNISEYLKQLYYKKYNIELIKLQNGDTLEFNPSLSASLPVTIDGCVVPDGKYELAYSNKTLLINNCRIIKELSNHTYSTNIGYLVIEQEFFSPAVGDLVFHNKNKAPDGKYKLSFLKNIFVKNGVITKKSMF